MRARSRLTFDANPLELIEFHLKVSGIAAVRPMIAAQLNSVAAKASFAYESELMSLSQTLDEANLGDPRASLAKVNRMIETPVIRAVIAWGQQVEQREGALYDEYELTGNYQFAFELAWTLAQERARWGDEYRPRPIADSQQYFDRAIEIVKSYGAEYGSNERALIRYTTNQVQNEQRRLERRIDLHGAAIGDSQPPYDDADESIDDVPGSPATSPRPMRDRRRARAQAAGNGMNRRRRRIDFDEGGEPAEEPMDDLPERPRGG